MNLILSCLALVLCGAGIGAAITWRIMYRPKPMTQERARNFRLQTSAKASRRVT